MKYMPWYLRWLGFNYRYITQVLSEPRKLDDSHWVYDCRLLKYEIWWLDIIKIYNDTDSRTNR